ncbi:MAG: hypothetical protein ACE37K_15160 [Planctomycetota bacterium]
MTEPEADDTPETPREPEIELLGKLARGGLFVIRMALLAAGVAALGYGLKKTLTIGDGWAWGGLEFRSTPSAAGFVWMTVGLPLALPANTLLNRGMPQAALLLTSAAMWFGPMALADDSAYGWILRLFATLVAFLCLVVWRTLWRLTEMEPRP